MEKKNEQKQKINIELDEKVAEGTYSNLAIINHSVSEFVIDFISVFLFLSRDLFLTALLFVGYLVIIIFGYRAWKLSMLETKKGINNK